MAFDQYTADRIDKIIQESGLPYFSKKMMGGLIFMVNDKMACATHYDKKKETDLLMVRIGEDAATANASKKGCHPMDFTGRPLRGYAFITPDGYDSEQDLEYWINLCLEYNPLAKRSKKRNKNI